MFVVTGGASCTGALHLNWIRMLLVSERTGYGRFGIALITRLDYEARFAAE